MSSVIDAIWDDIRYGTFSPKYSDLTKKDREHLIKNIGEGLPFTEYWIEKTLTEVDPVIYQGRYIDGGSVNAYLTKLIKNSNLTCGL